MEVYCESMPKVRISIIVEDVSSKIANIVLVRWCRVVLSPMHEILVNDVLVKNRNIGGRAHHIPSLPSDSDVIGRV